jgi:hypothetical protein
MPDMSVVPLLMPADWEGGRVYACRRLAAGLETGHLPWLTFGHDLPGSIKLIEKQEVKSMGIAPGRLEKASIRNLAREECNWEEERFDLSGGVSLRMLICGLDFLAAERILDQRFMKQAQRHLGAKLLAAGIPRRGLLFMTDGLQDLRALAAFALVVSAQYHRAQSTPIAPGVFGLVKGEIVGLMRYLEDAGKALVDEERGVSPVRSPSRLGPRQVPASFSSR